MLRVLIRTAFCAVGRKAVSWIPRFVETRRFLCFIEYAMYSFLSKTIPYVVFISAPSGFYKTRKLFFIIWCIMIYTAQYKYKGKDRIDITVKGATGAWKIFAPTWDMVNHYKHTGDKTVYKFLYQNNILSYALKHKANFINKIVKYSRVKDITLVCFCRSGDFCHRVLLAKWLEKEFYTKYGGERNL